MGICGTGVGALAGMLKNAGYQVSGSDQQVYPPMSDFLAGLGVPVREGYSAANLQPRPDLVVVGNVIKRDNPEALALDELAIPYVSFPQALAHYFIGEKKSLVVCGTHGKTTTASLLATMLHSAGHDAGFMIGGLVQAFGRNYHVGAGEYFVSEGDEYDTAFFDKGPKFLHYRPQTAILTSVEFDHADIYADFDAVKSSFRRLVEIMPESGALVACFDDPAVREIAPRARCRVFSYGQDPQFDWAIADLCIAPGGTTFNVLRHGLLYGKFESPMPGRHNALNSLAVIAVLDRIGLDVDVIRQGLAQFQGVKRRQEVRGIVNGITVIDDFAHHPTAVRETLASLAAAYKGRRLLAVFEPRTNSSRRNVFQEAYVSAFGSADRVLIREPLPLLHIPPAERFSSAKLVQDLCSNGIDALYFQSTEEILDCLSNEARSGDVIAIMSNGGFDDIHKRLLALFSRND